MGRWFLTFVVLLMWMNLGYAEDTTKAWTEVDVSAFERIDGEFAPEPSISVLNYNANKGIGLYVGRDRSAGPLVSWRVWEGNPDWFKDLKIAFHVIASSNLLDGDDVFDNGTSGLGVRIELAKGAEFAGKILWRFADDDRARFTPALGLVLRPL